jgi:hypothetical protein
MEAQLQSMLLIQEFVSNQANQRTSMGLLRPGQIRPKSTSGGLAHSHKFHRQKALKRIGDLVSDAY